MKHALSILVVSLVFAGTSTCIAQTQGDADDARIDANLARSSAMLKKSGAWSAFESALSVGAAAQIALGNYESIHGPQPALRQLDDEGSEKLNQSIAGIDAGQSWVDFGDGAYNAGETAYGESDWFLACVQYALAESYYEFGDLCFPPAKALAIQAEEKFQQVLDGIPNN